MSFEEANTMLASASVGLSGGIGTRLLGANAHLGLTKNWNETKSKSEIMSKATCYAEKEGLSTLMQKSISEGRDSRFNVNDSEGDTYMKGISTQLSKTYSHLSSSSNSFTQSQSYRKAAQHVESQSVAFNQDLSQKYVNWLADQELDGKKLGMERVNRVLADPEKSQEYISEFIKREVKGFLIKS